MEESFGHMIKLIDKQFKLRIEEKFEKMDITFAQGDVLKYLEEHEGCKITQKTLSEAFKVKHSTMAGILSRMQEKGLINILVDENNKKFKNIYRTSKTEKIKDEMSIHRKNTEKVVFKNFSEEEKTVLKKLLYRVYNNLLNDAEHSYENEGKEKNRL